MKATKSLDLGALQSNAEQAAKNYRAAATVLKRAQEAFDKSEQAHLNAQKTLMAGVEQLKASTKVV